MTLAGISASNGGVCGGAVCQFGTLANGATRTVTVTARVGSDVAAGSLTNTAAAYSTDESNQANNTATVNTTVDNQADISVTKVDLLDPWPPAAA